MSAKIKIGFTSIAFRKSFWGFTHQEYLRRQAQVKKLAASLGASCLASPQAFENDLKGRQAAALMNKTDLAILDVATFPEGKAALAFFDALQVPLVLWSRGESLHKSHIGHNSFCGANFLASNLALRGQRFRAIYGDLRQGQVLARLRTALRLIAAAKAAAGAKIGLFGEGIVPKFHDIDISANDRALLAKRYRIQFVNVAIKDLVKQAASYPAAAMAKAGRAFAQGFTQVQVDQAALIKLARLLQALRDMSRAGKFASIAIRCWPELQKLSGIWPCPAISILNDLGLPAACEGDPGGALDMLLASKLTNRATTLLDIVDWDDRANSVAIWHCGPTACSWADGPTQLRPHNVDGRTAQGQPALGLPAIVDMDFAPGPVTVFRSLGALDDEFVFEGNIVRAPGRHICGSFGAVTKIKSYGRALPIAELRESILNRTVPHHFAAARGRIFV